MYLHSNAQEWYSSSRAPRQKSTFQESEMLTMIEFAKRGAAARNAKLSPERRSEIGRIAATARWGKPKRKALKLKRAS